jgi:hypothetical protein
MASLFDTNINDLHDISFPVVREIISFEFTDDETKKQIITHDENIIYEKSLPNLFERPIPFRAGAKLLQTNQSLTCIPVKTKANATVTEVYQHSSLSIIFSLSCQRGPQTGCPYQVPVNCRAMSIHHLVTSSDGNNLMKSACDSSLENSFGEGDLTALTFFGVQGTDKASVNETSDFQMPSMMNLIDNDGHYRADDAVLQGRTAVRVSAVHFKRACRFFNHCWGTVDEDGNMAEYPDNHPLTSKDLHAFAMLFENHRLDSEEGWRHFLSEFGLEELFPYQKGVHVLVQIRRLGEFYRALVPLDCGVSRGQHRCHVMAFLGMGYFDCIRRVPLPQFSGSTYLIMFHVSVFFFLILGFLSCFMFRFFFFSYFGLTQKYVFFFQTRQTQQKSCFFRESTSGRFGSAINLLFYNVGKPTRSSKKLPPSAWLLLKSARIQQKREMWISKMSLQRW